MAKRKKRKSTIKGNAVARQSLFTAVIIIFTVAVMLLTQQPEPEQQISEQQIPAEQVPEQQIPDQPSGEIYVHFIDVGQGDSILIQTESNAVLIDAGAPSATQAVINHIESLGISTLDVVVATHPHNDHIGGLSGVIDRFNVKEIWMPDAFATTGVFERLLDTIERNGLEITTVMAGEILTAGEIEMVAVAPNREEYNNLNNYSIALHMQFGQTAFLFTGDIEEEAEREILASGRNIRADILDTPHHGSRTSSSEAFLDAVMPEVAVISVGAENRYGHPNSIVIDRMEEREIIVLRTDEMGTITLVTDGETVYMLN